MLRYVLAMVCLSPGATLANDTEQHGYDRPGPRGIYLAVGAGMLGGSAVDDAGARTSVYSGMSFAFRIGEEVFDRFSLGLMIGYGAGSGDDFDAASGALSLQVGYRPIAAMPALQFLGSTGVGGGTIRAEVDEGPEGGTGGAVYALGIAWEWLFGDDPLEGFALAPTLEWQHVARFGGEPARLDQLALGLQLVWHAGR